MRKTELILVLIFINYCIFYRNNCKTTLPHPILLTIFPVLYGTCPWHFVTVNLYFWAPSPFHPVSQPSSHRATISLFSVSMSLFLFYSFILLLDSTLSKIHNICLSLSIIPSRSIHVVTNDKITRLYKKQGPTIWCLQETWLKYEHT